MEMRNISHFTSILILVELDISSKLSQAATFDEFPLMQENLHYQSVQSNKQPNQYSIFRYHLIKIESIT